MKLGEFVQQPQGFKAFVPYPFPPQEEIVFSNLTTELHAKAAFYLGSLME